MTVAEPRSLRTSAALLPGPAPRDARTSSRSGWPGSTSPDVGRGVMRCHSALAGSDDRSGRSRIVLPAVLASSAISWPPLAMLERLADVAAVTPGARVIAPVAPSGSWSAASTRTSEPTAKAAWSAADCRQLAYPASASVVVATCDHHEQGRARLADRPPGDLPAHHGGGQPPSAVGRLVGQPGQQRQPAERDDRHPGQRECGGEGDHGIDPERSRGRMRDRRIAAQFPHRDRGERHQGQIAARPGDPREPGLPAAAEPGGVGGRGVQRRPGHHRDAHDQHGQGRQPGQRDDAAARIAAQAQVGQAGQRARSGGCRPARPPGRPRRPAAPPRPAPAAPPATW